MKAELLIVANFLFCSGIAWAAFCRLNAISRTVRLAERLKYTLLLVGSTASGIQGPLFGDVPNEAAVVFAGCVFVYLVAGMWQWKHGVPSELHKES